MGPVLVGNSADRPDLGRSLVLRREVPKPSLKLRALISKATSTPTGATTWSRNINAATRPATSHNANSQPDLRSHSTPSAPDRHDAQLQRSHRRLTKAGMKNYIALAYPL